MWICNKNLNNNPRINPFIIVIIGLNPLLATYNELTKFFKKKYSELYRIKTGSELLKIINHQLSGFER